MGTLREQSLTKVRYALLTHPTLVSIMRSGYTLPVFATAGAIAALRCLQSTTLEDRSIVTLDLLDPPQRVEISIEQVAIIQPDMALGITRSDPGENLDLTRDTPIWTVVEWADVSQVEPVVILGGEGVGKQSNLDNLPAIYSYARRLLQANLAPLLIENQKIRVTIILPEGRVLATRTSNESFGVVEGLSLLGTTGISQPLSAPGQLDLCLSELRSKAATLDLQSPLVFCIGENGLDLAQRIGIERDRIIKTANWLGPLLAEAGLLNLPQLLLFGYHGKLIKLAGGIFHTHHHLADGRLEILVAAAARVGLPAPQLGGLFACETAEAVLSYLGEIDSLEGSIWVKLVYGYLADRIDARSQTYIYSQSQRRVSVGSVLFDRQREIIVASPIGSTLLAQLC
jgi:cobalt-precorrin-5B (C1)-methyltransferase